MSNQKLVTVVMPTYNDEMYLSNAIDDVLKQTYKNFELIIVNDGSTDGTQKLLEKYAKKDKRIKLFEKKNGGTGSALNLGFKNASGYYGTWVSSDDRKSKTFLQDLVEVLEKNKDIEYVFSSFYSSYLKTNFRPIQPTGQNEFIECLSGISHDNILTENVFFLDKWAHYNSLQCFQGVCFLFTMKLKDRCGEYIEIPGEDYHMCMKMALETRIAYLDKSLGTHENPADSLSMQNRNCVIEANKLTKELFRNTKHWSLNYIPKIASFYWGSDKMSFLRYLTIYSFKKLNPDWSIHLYMPKNVSKKVGWRKIDSHHKCDVVDYNSTKNYFNKLLKEIPLKIIEVDFSKSFLKDTSSEAHRSDICGWTVLASGGGLWCDMDVIFFKPIKDSYINCLNKKNYDTFICIDNRQDPVRKLSPIGFLMSSGQNEFFKNILNFATKNYNPNKYQCCGADIIQIKLNNDIEKIKKLFFKNKFHNISPSLVYHYDFKNLDKIYDKNNLINLEKTDAIGVHWYGGHPTSQVWNNKVDNINFNKFNNTITEIINKINYE